MRLSRDFINTRTIIENDFNLDYRLHRFFLTYDQIISLIEIEKMAKNVWHENYLAAKNHITPNPGRVHNKIVTPLDKLLSVLKKDYMYTESKIIEELQALKHRIPDLKKDTLIPTEVLDHHIEETHSYLKMANFSKTAIKKILPIIKKMIITGE